MFAVWPACNGADGISDIEGKVTRVGASERGQRASFNRDRVPDLGSAEPALSVVEWAASLLVGKPGRRFASVAAAASQNELDFIYHKPLMMYGVPRSGVVAAVSAAGESGERRSERNSTSALFTMQCSSWARCCSSLSPRGSTALSRKTAKALTGYGVSSPPASVAISRIGAIVLDV